MLLALPLLGFLTSTKPTNVMHQLCNAVGGIHDPLIIQIEHNTSRDTTCHCEGETETDNEGDLGAILLG